MRAPQKSSQKSDHPLVVSYSIGHNPLLLNDLYRVGGCMGRKLILQPQTAAPNDVASKRFQHYREELELHN